jgi:predicted permease
VEKKQTALKAPQKQWQPLRWNGDSVALSALGFLCASFLDLPIRQSPDQAMILQRFAPTAYPQCTLQNEFYLTRNLHDSNVFLISS